MTQKERQGLLLNVPAESWQYIYHNYSKLFLLKSYNSLHKFGIICVLETYLDSTSWWWDFEKFSYALVRSDHQLNTKLKSLFF